MNLQPASRSGDQPSNVRCQRQSRRSSGLAEQPLIAKALNRCAIGHRYLSPRQPVQTEADRLSGLSRSDLARIRHERSSDSFYCLFRVRFEAPGLRFWARLAARGVGSAADRRISRFSDTTNGARNAGDRRVRRKNQLLEPSTPSGLTSNQDEPDPPF